MHTTGKTFQQREASAADRASLSGIFASPKEAVGFTDTVLLLERDPKRLMFRMRFRTDMHATNEIRQDELYGTYLAADNVLYLPIAAGYIENGEPSLMSYIQRYTLSDINGQQVLISDDALEDFRTNGNLDVSGILLKVSDRTTGVVDLGAIAHPTASSLPISHK